MTVRKLLVTDIRCRTCKAAPGEGCTIVLGVVRHDPSRSHGERLADHAELERAGWEWQEVDPTDRGDNRKGRKR